MRLIKNPQKMLEASRRYRKANKKIGFVPTMGYLHEGHTSLIKQARKDNNIVVVSIFVNPIQFGPREDYKEYPRDLSRDKRILLSAGVDIIFHPNAKDIYPEGYNLSIDPGPLSDLMCGKSRPGHFSGVCTICAKLFNIVNPHIAYFGQKDYQQAIIIKKMARDLNMGIRIKALPIVREPDGLAMSSRNIYLTKAQRRDASVIYESLKKAKVLVKEGCRSVKDIRAAMRRMILSRPQTRVDYITVADPNTLEEINVINSKVVIAVAAWVGKTRLIDNIVIARPKGEAILRPKI